MILRSGRRIGGDAVIIDFDYSSREWRKNKIAIGQGSFKYQISNINMTKKSMKTIHPKS